MLTQKIKSTQYHNQFQELMSEQLSTIDKLNEIRKKSGNSKISISRACKSSFGVCSVSVFRSIKSETTPAKIEANRKRIKLESTVKRFLSTGV